MSFDRNFIVVNNDAAASVVTMDAQLPGGNPELEIDAWQVAGQGYPVYVMEGELSLAEAQNRIQTGIVDSIICPSSNGSATMRYPNDVNRFTVFFSNGFANNPQVLSIRIREVKK